MVVDQEDASQKYHNTFCCPSKILHKREIESNAYAKFWRDNKQYYGIFLKAYLGYNKEQ